jgi:hypothetical protein
LVMMEAPVSRLSLNISHVLRTHGMNALPSGDVGRLIALTGCTFLRHR